MPAKIIPQSGVLEVQGRIKANSAVNDLDVLTKKDFATKKEVQFRAGQTTTSFPKVIAVKISDGYEGDLPQGQVYSSETDTILGIANQTLANGSNYFLITNGVVDFNTTGANINDPIYADASTGNLSLIAAAKKVGVVLEVGVNGKVLINLGGESSSGGAGGDTNFIVDPNAAGGDANKFIEYLNAGTTPTNGSGGSASNISFAKETASPLLRTAGDWKLTKAAANGQGEGIAYDFDIEPGFVGRTLELTFNYSTSAYYVSSDIGVFIYDKTNLSLIATNINDVSQTMGSPGTFICKFPATSSSLRIIFHVRTTNALAYTFSFSDLSVRPESRIVGAALGDWQDFPSVAAGTLITSTGISPTYGNIVQNRAIWKRIGDSMEISWNFRQSTAGTNGTGNYLFNLPAGYKIDTTKFIANTTLPISSVGKVYFYSTDSAEITVGDIFIYSDTQLHSIFNLYSNNISTNNIITWGPTFWFGTANITFSIKATVPIVGWSSNVNLIQNATEFAYNTSTVNSDDTTSFGYGSDGVLFTNTSGTGILRKRVRFRQPIQITDKIEVEVWNGQGWQSLPHAADAASGGVFIDVFKGENINSANNYIGVGYRIINSTDVDVTFGKYAAGRSYTDTSEWSEVTSSGFKWRVRKSSGSAVAEIPPFVGARYTTTISIVSTPAAPFNFATKVYDTHNAVTTGAGWKFTAPIAGYYSIKAIVVSNANVGGQEISVYKNGSYDSSICNRGNTTDIVYSLSGSTELYLNQGDYIDLRSTSFTTATTAGQNYIAISKIG